MAFRTAASGGMIKEKLRSKLRRACFRQRGFFGRWFYQAAKKNGRNLIGPARFCTFGYAA
jgi:hypothetical protein